MIFEATSRVEGLSPELSPNFPHTVSSASDISRIASGSKALPARNGRIGTISHSRFIGSGIVKIRCVVERLVAGQK
jgi:hypothetical protein